MNRRQKKKIENRRRKVLHELLDFVLDVNGMQASNKKETGSHPTAFLDIHGHIANVRVCIYKNGWAYQPIAPDEMLDRYIYFDSQNHDFESEARELIKDAKCFLEE